jgi:hypothetical protein
MDVVTCHDIVVALEVEHFVEVTYDDLCRGGRERGKTIAWV